MINCENNESLLIQQSDFECIGQVAKHCDLSKLCVAISEAQMFDMEGLFCSFWIEILKYNNVVTNGGDFSNDFNNDFSNEHLEKINELICGSTYIGCNGEERRHYGIKRILTYYAYSRYVLINAYNDTPNGIVQKTNDFSIPTPLKELQSTADRYRSMGYNCFLSTIDFLCVNRSFFEKFNAKNCKDCGCGDKCSQNTKATGYGFRSKIINKK